jgi:hypothetical protein
VCVRSASTGSVRGVLGNWHPYRDRGDFQSALPRVRTLLRATLSVLRWAVSETRPVAVGMPVTQHPPHRTSARAPNAHGSHLEYSGIANSACRTRPARLSRFPGSVSGTS